MSLRERDFEVDLDTDALKRWLLANLPDLTTDDLEVTGDHGSRSNLNLAVTGGSREWIARVARPRRVLPASNNTEREFRVLDALAGSGVPVPRVLARCDDPSIAGSTFYLMEKVQGIVVRSHAELALYASDDARRCSAAVVEALAAVHSVDLDEVGLADLEHSIDPMDKIAEPLARWEETREQFDAGPAMDELASRLVSTPPPCGPTRLVHGDFRLDNLMLDHADRGRVVSVLDWELVGLGDPLYDLAYLLVYWDGMDPELSAIAPVITTEAGFLDREAMIERYARRTGDDVSRLEYYEALALFRLALFVTVVRSQADDRGKPVWGLDFSAGLVERLAERALDLAAGSSIPEMRGMVSPGRSRS